MPAATIIVPSNLSDRELEKIRKVADAKGQRVIIDYPDEPAGIMAVVEASPNIELINVVVPPPPETYPGEREAQAAVARGEWTES